MQTTFAEREGLQSVNAVFRLLSFIIYCCYDRQRTFLKFPKQRLTNRH